MVAPAYLPLMTDLLEGTGLTVTALQISSPPTTTSCGFTAPRGFDDAELLLRGRDYVGVNSQTITPDCLPAALTR